MRQHTSKGNCRANQCVQFFVTANGELQMTRSDTLDFKILGGIPSKLEDFGCEIL